MVLLLAAALVLQHYILGTTWMLMPALLAQDLQNPAALRRMVVVKQYCLLLMPQWVMLALPAWTQREITENLCQNNEYNFKVIHALRLWDALCYCATKLRGGDQIVQTI